MGAHRSVEVGLPRLSRCRRGLPVGLVVSAVLMALLFGVAGPARADSTVAGAETISGRVTDVQGNGLNDVWVSASNLSGPDGPGGSANVDANGRYTLTGLVPGDYRIWFAQGPTASGAPVTGDLVSLYYGQKTPSDPWTLVHVSAGETVTGIDMQLHQGGGISGTVTDDQGNPLADVAVFVEGAGAWTTTDAAGHYALSDLEPRSYTVYFDAEGTDYFPQNYGGAALPPSPFGGPPPDSSGYTLVTVTAGATTGGIDVQLYHAGAITGTVTDQQGHPLAGISVNIAPPGSGPVPPGRAGEVTTDAAGDYRLGRLLPGAYRVSFAGEGFAGQLYGAAQSQDAAIPVNVPAGGVVSGIDAQMQLAGSISGNVLDPAGQPVNAFVDAYNPDGTIASFGGANSGGFTINNLTPGSYLLYATALDAPLAGFYTDPLGSGPAGLVHVTSGVTTTGIDIHATAPVPGAPGRASSSHVNPIHGTLAVSRNGTLAVTLRCTGPSACAGTASLTVASPASAVTRRARTARTTISHKRFLVRASHATPVRLRLTPAGRSLLHRHHGRMTAHLTIAAPNGSTTQTLVAHLRSTR